MSKNFKPPPPSMEKLKPVVAVAAMGREKAMCPVMTDIGTVKMPSLLKITQFLPVLRSTGSCTRAVVHVVCVH